MKVEEKVGTLSEELKKVNAEIDKNHKDYLQIDETMEKAYDSGDYDVGEYMGWVNSKDWLTQEKKKLTKHQQKLVNKLRKLIARHKLLVDEETAALLK